MQIGWQSNRCFDRRTGAHTTLLLKFGIFHQNTNASRRMSRVHPASRPLYFRGRLCSSIRTNWNLTFLFFIRSQSWMQGVCSEFRTGRRSKAGCRDTSAPVRSRLFTGERAVRGALVSLCALGITTGSALVARTGAPPSLIEGSRNSIQFVCIYLINLAILPFCCLQIASICCTRCKDDPY